MFCTMHDESPIGPLLLVEKDGAPAGVWMEGQKYYLGGLQGEMKENKDSEILCRANGSLTGYAGGLEKKIKLLTFKGADMEKLFVPAKTKPF